ncbi:hypothetical protein BDR05DRAFT_943457 [Suillus weaverae]|nr:hypothetical protein BDR05DRAFT_943457 [Suillus weaverae]
MDSVLEGWIRNVTISEKAEMDLHVTEIISQASIKFNCVLLASKYLKDFVTDALMKDHRQHMKRAEKFVYLYNLESPSKMSDVDCKSHMHKQRTETPTSTDVIVFAHPAVKGVNMLYWYESKKSLLCDEEMRSLISITPLPMLLGSAAATKCVIDCKQDLITSVMLYSLQTDIHGESFKKHLLDLHHKGLQALHKMLKIPPKITIYIPVTMEELSIPRPIPYADTLSLPVQMSDQAPSMGVQPQMMVLAQNPMSDLDVD